MVDNNKKTKPTSQVKSFYLESEAAKALGVTVGRLAKWRQCNLGPSWHTHIGSRLNWYEAGEIARYISYQRQIGRALDDPANPPVDEVAGEVIDE